MESVGEMRLYVELTDRIQNKDEKIKMEDFSLLSNWGKEKKMSERLFLWFDT